MVAATAPTEHHFFGTLGNFTLGAAASTVDLEVVVAEAVLATLC